MTVGSYESTGDRDELDRLIDRLAGRRAAEPDAHERLALSNDLATLLWTRYEATGDLTDLDRAIGELRGALATVAGDDPLRLSLQVNLGGALRDRSILTGADDDLAEGVELMRAAVRQTRPDDPAYAGRHTNLGSVLLMFHLRSGHTDVLYEARRVCQIAIDAAAGDAPPPGDLSNLAECLRQIHHLTGDLSAIEAAVDLARRAATLPATHVLYGRYQANLSLALTSRHRAGGRPDAGTPGPVPAGLAEALRASRAACAATPAGHPNEPERYGGYARVLELIYEAAPDRGALAELRRVARTAVTVTPRGHPAHGRALNSRALAEFHHAQATGDAASTARVLDSFSAIVLAEELPVIERVAAAHQLALLVFTAHGDMPGLTLEHALATFQLAVDLLPQVARRDLTMVDRERDIGHFANLARDAAACALTAGRPDLALTLLEQGRGMLLSQALEMWPDLVRLRAGHPDVAEEFERLREATEAIGAAGATDPDPVAAARRRSALARHWTDLLAGVRATPAFADFLRAPAGPELLRVGAPGAVVLVNVSGLRSDALIITGGGVRILPLPGLDLARTQEQAARLAAAVAPAGGGRRSLTEAAAGERSVREVLTWLWHALVLPVLTAVGHRARPGQPLPRLCWIPTGPLSAMPLHAAGDYATPGGESALDRVVCSYAPTIRSLQRHRARPAPEGPPRQPLVVAVPQAGTAPVLADAATEGRTVAGLYPGARLLLGPDATVRAVLDGLARHDWAHFAGHARSVPDDPGSGHLLAFDGPVTVRDISRHQLAEADLAFLSSCETTRGGAHLTEEAVHLTGACHLAGFRHVIGTLWRTPDDIAARIATDIHTTLAAAPHGSHAAAEAVNLAARRVRADYPDACTLWSAHIHVGG